MPFVKKFLGYSLFVVSIITYHSIAKASSLTNTFSKDASYQVCFTPGGDCTKLIVNLIDNAKKSVYIQAYSFTSAPIASAIVNAKNKNIDVRVILDRSQKTQKYSSSRYLTNSNVPVWIDQKPAIAHNKIIIIDNNIVITGSFNFTKAAQYRNAENVIVINDQVLAKLYLENFNVRMSESFKI